MGSEVKTVGDLIGQINEIVANWPRNSNGSGTVWYRGVMGGYPLVPRALRDDWAGRRESAESLFNDFCYHCPPSTYDHRPESKFADYVAAQHYGLPTRLLDWTEDLLGALYFAVCPNDEVNTPKCCVPQIWVFDPTELNARIGVEDVLLEGRSFTETWHPDEFSSHLDGWRESRDDQPDSCVAIIDSTKEPCETPGADAPDDQKKKIVPDEPIALYAYPTNVRMKAQSGCFTVHGLNPKPVDELHLKRLISVNIAPNAIGNIQRALSLLNYNRFRLFQDAESLSASLLKKYKHKQAI